ncbi:hypothetical protein CPC08DRAFT_727725 [Agrocybe pediades]|nr:hypothetical protein CPC08DRAFT_727725 [Agrocybe pediades]
MPKPWTTKEQLAWLNLRKNDYIEAQKTGRSTPFLTLLKEQWFVDFPALQECFPGKQPNAKLTEDEEKKLGNHIRKRKKQIDRWYPWHTLGHKTPRGNNISGYMKMLRNQSRKRERAPQEVEAYMKLYSEKVSAAYGAGPNKFKMGVDVANAKRSIAKELLEGESAEVKEEVRVEVEKEKARIYEEMKTEVDGDVCKSTTPEEFQRGIDEVPSFLDAAMQSVVDSTGYEVFVMIGGPVPENKGHMSIEHYHYGPHTPAGANFSQTCVNFKDITDAFTKHAFKCFPEHVRAARALVLREEEEQGEPNAQDMDETSKAEEIGGKPSSDGNEAEDDGMDVRSLHVVEDGGNTSSYGREADNDDMDVGPLHIVEDNANDKTDDVFRDLIPMPRDDTVEPPDVNRPASNMDSTAQEISAFAIGEASSNTHQTAPLQIPPSHGGPSEPYEYAFMRMTLPQAPPTLHASDGQQRISDKDIDPVLRSMGKGAEQQRGPAGAPVNDIRHIDYVVPRPMNRELAIEGGRAKGGHGGGGHAIGEPQEGEIQAVNGGVAGATSALKEGGELEDSGAQRDSQEIEVEVAKRKRPTKKVPAKESQQSRQANATYNSADQETLAAGRQRRSIRPPIRPDGEPMSPLFKQNKRKNGKENNDGGKEGRKKRTRNNN